MAIALELDLAPGLAQVLTLEIAQVLKLAQALTPHQGLVRH